MKNNQKIPPLIVIVGETASGKTSAGIEVAKKVRGEIICADSRTVYKQMDIGTAKPTKDEQNEIPHHLIDVIEPDEQFSAAEFKERAQKLISEITERGNIPIIVGGTGLYIDAVLYDFQFNHKPNEAYRTQLLQMSDEKLTTLMNTKNINADKLNTKNRRHVIRAIERGEEPPVNSNLRENTLVLGLKLDREVLKSRIDQRVEQMFKVGFIDEVKNLVEKYGWENESMSGIGYRVARDYIEGNARIEEVKSAFKKRDLSLAKRQRTWFKRNKNIKWFDKPGDLINQAVAFADQFDYN